MCFLFDSSPPSSSLKDPLCVRAENDDDDDDVIDDDDDDTMVELETGKQLNRAGALLDSRNCVSQRIASYGEPILAASKKSTKRSIPARRSASVRCGIAERGVMANLRHKLSSLQTQCTTLRNAKQSVLKRVSRLKIIRWGRAILEKIF